MEFINSDWNKWSKRDYLAMWKQIKPRDFWRCNKKKRMLSAWLIRNKGMLESVFWSFLEGIQRGVRACVYILCVGSDEASFSVRKICWKTCLIIRNLEMFLEIYWKMFCNMFAKIQKVRTFATLSRGKRTEELTFWWTKWKVTYFLIALKFFKKTSEKFGS